MDLSAVFIVPIIYKLLGTPNRSSLSGDNSSSSYTNTFDNMDFGIYGTDAQIKVQNNYFKNITGSGKSEDIDHGGGYRAIGPVEIGIAVNLQHSAGGTYDLTVGSNTVLPLSGNPYPNGNVFENCNRGIKSDNSYRVYAHGNVFTSASTDIPVVTTMGSPPMYATNPNTYYFYKAQSAVWITGSASYAEVYYNYMLNHGSGVFATPTASGTTHVKVMYNDISAPSATGWCKNAIQLQQLAGSMQAVAEYNAINNVYNGIAVSGINDPEIRYNTVSVERLAKTYNHTATSNRTGISLSNCDYGYVQGNTLTSNTVGGALPTTTTTARYLNGLWLTNSAQGKVECNSATNLGRDFIFTGTCNNTWLVNSMSNSYTGLEIATNGVIGQQGASSGSPNLSANTWTTITRETNAVSSPSVNQTSKLFLQSGATTQPTLNFASGTGVTPYSTISGGINVATGTPYICNAGNAQRITHGDTKGNRSVEENDSLMLYTVLATNNESAYEVFPEEAEYHNKQMVYSLIKKDSIRPLDSSSLFNFYNANQNTVIDQLTQVEHAMGINHIVNAINKNNSVTATNSVEQKHKRANELVLKYLSDNMYQFTSDERADLYSMANECLVKGNYVAQSRNIINLISGSVVLYDDNCEEEGNNSRKAKPSLIIEPQASFLLYPNPNNGTMQLDYNLGNDSKGIMKLFDVTGKLIRSYKLDDNKGILQLNEQGLHNGIYFYRILVGEKIVKNDKIVIIK